MLPNMRHANAYIHRDGLSRCWLPNLNHAMPNTVNVVPFISFQAPAQAAAAA